MPPLEPFIDAHSHVWTPDLGHYPLAPGYRREDMQPASFTAEELLALCRPSGVGRVNLIQMSWYGFDNSYMLDMIRLYPDRFVGTAIIDHTIADPGRRMLELKTKGVRAFRIRPEFQGGRIDLGGAALPPDRWLEPPGYLGMFAAAGRNGQALSCLINPDGFAEIDRMCARFPETTVIIDHLGRIGVAGTIRDEEVESLCRLARHPRVMVKVGAFYALGQKTPPYLDLEPMIRRVIQAFGADRCLWESDCPFQVVRDRYQDSIDLIQKGLEFLKPEDRLALLSRSAEKLLFS